MMRQPCIGTYYLVDGFTANTREEKAKGFSEYSFLWLFLKIGLISSTQLDNRMVNAIIGN